MKIRSYPFIAKYSCGIYQKYCLMKTTRRIFILQSWYKIVRLSPIPCLHYTTTITYLSIYWKISLIFIMMSTYQYQSSSSLFFICLCSLCHILYFNFNIGVSCTRREINNQQNVVTNKSIQNDLFITPLDLTKQLQPLSQQLD